uniref:Uncharacterized protein n=1 Tax=Myotis myotis TaxID=51298 RepID=A0A7J7RUK8_MYOMY|nr:hypothetical protein mMyoMyo1_010125 [Myotis myotis]
MLWGRIQILGYLCIKYPGGDLAGVSGPSTRVCVCVCVCVCVYACSGGSTRCERVLKGPGNGWLTGSILLTYVKRVCAGSGWRPELGPSLALCPRGWQPEGGAQASGSSRSLGAERSEECGWGGPPGRCGCILTG